MSVRPLRFATFGAGFWARFQPAAWQEDNIKKVRLVFGAYASSAAGEVVAADRLVLG